MYGWAPLAIMGEEINRLSSSPSSVSNPHSTSYGRSSTEEETTVEMSLMAHDPLSTTTMPEDISSSSTMLKTQQQPDIEGNDDNEAMAGLYLGIFIIFSTIPQFLATFISMIVFSILEPGQSPELAGDAATTAPGDQDVPGKVVTGGGLSGTAVCLAIGAVFQLVAAMQSLRMRRGY